MTWEDFSLEEGGNKIKCKECGAIHSNYTSFDKHMNEKHGIMTFSGLGTRNDN